MDFKIIVGFCVILLCCSLTVDSKAVAKTDAKKQESKTNKDAETDLKDSGSGSDDDTPIDCDPEKLKKCNIICEKSKTVEKRACNCKEEQSRVECAQKRRSTCEGKKKCQKRSHGHGVEKRCKSAQGKKKSCDCSSQKKASPLMQRVFRFPAIMITPIKNYNGDEKGVEKKGSKRCGDCCCHHCCCCEPCCCCCCEPCCCCHECCCPCCCHCCHCCHCCPCCCGCCGCGCKKSKNAPAPVPAAAPNAVAKSQ